MEDPDSTENESVHTLQCLPNGQTQSGEMIMSCKEQPDRQPITVIISSEGLDLTTLARKNVKIVVCIFLAHLQSTIRNQDTILFLRALRSTVSVNYLENQYKSDPLLEGGGGGKNLLRKHIMVP